MKTRFYTAILAIMLISSNVFSQPNSKATYFAGAITKDTVWGSSVILSTDITVPAGITLTINNGVTVYFVKGNNKLIINGRLVTNGLPNEKVIFTSNETTPQKGDWSGIVINSQVPELSSVITNTEIQYAVDGIIVNNTFSSINNVKILNCSRNGLNIISGSSKITRINNSNITQNDSCGVYVENSTVKIINSSMSNSGIGVLVTGGSSNTDINYSDINENLIYGVVYRKNSAGIIRNSKIWDNYFYGVAVFSNAYVKLDSNNIYGNFNCDIHGINTLSFNYMEWGIMTNDNNYISHIKKAWTGIISEDTLMFIKRNIYNITYKKDADLTTICAGPPGQFSYMTYLYELINYQSWQDQYSAAGTQGVSCGTNKYWYTHDMNMLTLNYNINILLTDYSQLRLGTFSSNMANSRSWVSHYTYKAISTYKQIASYNQLGYAINVNNCWLGQTSSNDTLIYQHNSGTVNAVNLLNSQIINNGFSDTRQKTIQISPNGEEKWEVRSQQYITWIPHSNKELKLEFTSNNGANWKTIANNVKSYTGYYKWMVPDTIFSASKVKISDMTNPNEFDVSDTSFSIIPQNAINAQAFNLIAPTNYSTDVAVYPKFEWQSAFPNKNEGGTYILRYGYDANFTTGTYVQVENIWNTYYYPEYDLSLDSIYYWKVFAVNSNGSMTECYNQYQFQTITQNPLVFNKTFGNRTLNKRNTPYKLLGNFLVDLQHRFTVPAGITVNMSDSSQITVKGEIRTLGTQTDSVKLKSLTSNSAGKWKGIKFVYGANDLKILQDTIIYTGSAFYFTSITNTGLSSTNVIDGVIPSYNTLNFYVQNCKIRTNSGYAIFCGSESIIKYSLLDSNGGGINGGKIFSNNTISNNNNYGIDAGYCKIFEGNTVINNKGFGVNIGYSTSDTVFIRSNIIKNNNGLNTTQKFGLYTNDYGMLENNSITNNTGSGINGGLTFYNDSVAYNTTYGINASAGKVFNNVKVNNNGTYGINAITANKFLNAKVSNNGGYGIQTDNPIFYGIIVLNNSNFGVNAINSNSLKRSVISNNLGYGIKIGTNLLTAVIIDSNTISGNTSQNTTEKFGIMTNSQAVFKNNIISYNQTAGVDGGKSFTNDSVYYNSGNGLQTQSNTDVSLTNYFSQGNGLSGVYIYGSPASITVLNCLFKQDVGQGLSISNTNALYVYNTIVIGDTINNTTSNPPNFTGEMGMSVENSRNINIKNSVFKNWWAGGLSFFNSRQISIINDSIINNKWIGIYVTGGDTVNIDSSEVMYNGSITNNEKGGGVYLNIDHARLTNSLLNFNKSKNGGGLYINSFSPFIYNNTFYSNQCSTNGGAIFTGGTTTTNPTLVYNTIVNNSSSVNTGGGIYILKTNINRAKISRNIISENLGHGIYGDPDSLIQNNLTYNKFINGSTGYALRKTNNVNLDATFNWWGTRSDQVAVENMIYHKQDSSSLGLVSFQPFLGSPSTQAPGQITQANSINIFTDTSYTTTYAGSIMIGQKAFMQLNAVDANPYSRDVTPIQVKNLRTNQSIEAIAIETGISSGIFRDTAKVMTSTNFNLNQIGGINGDTILFYSTVTPTVQKRLIVTSILAPQLVSPLNNAVGVLVSTNFVWRKVIGATSYRLQIATDSLFGNIVTNDSLITDSIKTVTGLSPSTYYYWRVNSVNNFGNGSFSEVRSFKTLNNPSTIVQSYPANGATSLPTTLTFKWYKSTDIIDGWNNDKKFDDQRNLKDKDILSPDFITNYWFEYSTDSSFTTVTGRDTLLTDTLKTVAGLNNFTKYYWRVKAKNEIGWGTFSDKWNFSTVLAMPLLTLPANNSTGISLTPLLTWGVVTGATSYRIQVSTDSLFATTQWDTTGVTAVTANVPAGKLTGLTKYYWRVNGTNESGTGAWSTVWNFRTLQNLTLNLKVYLEGFWNGSSQVSDSITVYLANTTTPFAFMDSAKVLLSTTGTAIVNFTKAPNGSYYIAVNHRNHLETWSKLAQSFVTNAAVNYDFTTAANKAFGDNMKQVGSVWVLYGGDGNRDGSIDALDVFAFIGQFGNSGYLSCDFNGDESVDALDVPIIIANFGLGKSVPTLDVQIGGNIRKERVVEEIQKLFKLNGESQKKETLKNKN